jgi:hypothetical protein
MYVCMYVMVERTRPFLLPEKVDGFYSCSVFKSLHTEGRCPVYTM